jgi:hypothetical protein
MKRFVYNNFDFFVVLIFKLILLHLLWQLRNILLNILLLGEP